MSNNEGRPDQAAPDNSPTSTSDRSLIERASAPSVAIVFELERAPRIVLDAESDSEVDRLRDWILSHPKLAAIYDAAYDLEGGEWW